MEETTASMQQPILLRLVREWNDLHAAELQEDWDLARAGMDLKKINPLD